MNNFPNLYVPGFPKSATTSICHALAQHPGVFAPVTAEPHYWASDMPFYAQREGFDSKASYQSLYQRATDAQRWRLDGSTLYMYSETAATSIIENVPDAKFIVCLRAAEDIVLAWHMQMLNGGYETEQDPQSAFNLSVQRRQGISVPQHCPDKRLLDYEQIASVGTQLGRLVKSAGAERVHVVTMASVIHKPQATLEACWNFLNLPNQPDIALGKNNSAFAVRHAWLRRSLYHPSVKPRVSKILNALPAGTGELTRNIFRKLVYQKAKRQPPAENFTRNLHDYYSQERQLLRSCLPGISGAPDPDDPLHKDLLG